MSPPRLGFGLPVAGAWARRDAMAEVARRAEAAGYHSLWTFQRLLNPAGETWAPVYRSVHDPIVTLAYAAGVTERVRLAVAVVNAPFYAPIVLAKQLTTLDEVSAGRLDVGLGLGWSPTEFAAAGVDYARRGARMEEYLACLRAIWTEDPVRFDGEFYTVPPARVAPRPRQRPHPPLLLGGSAAPALRRAGRLADGWVSASRHDLTRIGAAIAEVRAAAEQAGRDPAALRFVVRGLVRPDDPVWQDGRRRPLTGSVAEIRADLDRLGEAGVTEVFVDGNFDERIGSPEVEPATALERAYRVLDLLAPAAG